MIVIRRFEIIINLSIILIINKEIIIGTQYWNHLFSRAKSNIYKSLHFY